MFHSILIANLLKLSKKGHSSSVNINSIKLTTHERPILNGSAEFRFILQKEKENTRNSKAFFVHAAQEYS